MLIKIIIILTFSLILISQDDQNFEIPSEFSFISRMEYKPDSVLNIINQTESILKEKKMILDLQSSI